MNSKLNKSLTYNSLFVGNGSNEAVAFGVGTNGQVLTVVGGSVAWQTPTPPGDVSGPGSSTDRGLASWNGTSGDALYSSTATIDASNNLAGIANVTLTAGSALRTATSAGNTLLLQAYDVDGTAYVTFATLTANNHPTMDLGTGVTIGGAAIYRVGGTDVAVADGGTGLSSYTVGDILYADGAASLAQLAAGTSGYVLTSNGAGVAPSWQAASSVSGLTADRIPFATSSTTLGDDGALTWDNTNKILNLNGMKIFTGIWDGAPNYDNLFITSGMNDWANIVAGDNIGIGEGALYSATGAVADNIALGANALFNITNGSRNIAIGTNAGANTSVTYGNIFIGYNTVMTGAGALGQYNVLLGFGIDGPTDGSYNVLIGNALDIQSVNNDGQLSIQNAIFGTGNTGIGTTPSTGNIGIYTVAPTARLHLPAGTATANTAPLKFTSGTALTTPENGAIEYHSSHLYFTDGGTRYQLDHALNTDVSGQISGLTEKTTPIDADLLLIEDSAASNAKKKVQRSNLFGKWTSYAPTFGGFSADPTYTAYYVLIGKMCIVSMIGSALGTSNATTFTITLPFNANGTYESSITNVVNSGAIQANGKVTTSAASNVATLLRSLNAAWTASSTKIANFLLIYEIE